MATTDRTRLGKHLRKLRGDRTLAEVSASSGIDKAILSRVENGEVMPSLRTLRRLRHFYAVDDDAFLYWLELIPEHSDREPAA